MRERSDLNPLKPLMSEGIRITETVNGCTIFFLHGDFCEVDFLEKGWYKKGMNTEGNPRLSIPQYVMALAHVAALRSEDPYRKVGAAALDEDNRVIGTAYNGLYPGFTAPEGFWDDREERQKFMLHAEINLCSLFKRGEATVVACTTMPCTSCMQALCAHGVKKIFYGEEYKQSEAPLLAEKYDVDLIYVEDYPLKEQYPLVSDGSRLAGSGACCCR